MGSSSVFISHRRQISEQLALLVRMELTEHRFDTFVDLENLDSGEFKRTILSQIEAREHFIVLLQPGSLDRIGEHGDWLRREIAHALAHGRNVVPVTANGFEFRPDLVLPPDVARLPQLNAVAIQPGYFDEAMERLRTRFLKMPSKPATPPPAQTSGVAGLDWRAVAISGERTSAGAPVLPAPELAGRYVNLFEAQLTWSEVPGADEYVLERAEESSPFFLPDFREVYRGPDRSYEQFPLPIVGPHEVYGVRVLPRPLPTLLRYRVRAGASGKAGKWSDTLELREGSGV